MDEHFNIDIKMDISLSYKVSSNIKKNRVAAFDMDYTIVTPRKYQPGNILVFPKYRDPDDYRFIPGIKEVITDLFRRRDYRIAIFTNQASVSKDEDIIETFQKKLDNISDNLEITLDCFIATSYDNYRKPNKGMWEEYTKILAKNNVKIDLSKSFFVGDADCVARDNIGHKDPNGNKRCDDYNFAKNIGIDFYNPDYFKSNYNSILNGKCKSSYS